MNKSRHHWFKESLKINKKLYGNVILAATMINLLSVASSIFILVVYDRVIPNSAFSSLFALTIGMIIVFIFDFILKNLRAWFLDLAGHNLDLDAGEKIFKNMLEAPLEKISESIGGLANTLKEFDLVKEFFTSASLVLLVDLPFIALFILVIYFISGSLAIVPLIAVPIVCCIGIFVQPYIAKYSHHISETGKDKHSLIIESLSGLDAIKTNQSSSLFIDRYKSILMESAESSRKSKLLSQLATNSASSAQLLSMVGIIFYGTFLIDEGSLSMGALVASVLLSSRALSPLAQAANLFGRLNAASTSYKKIDSLMQNFGNIDNSKSYITINNLEDLEIRNLNFSYPSSNRKSLSQINLRIKSGEKVAIMGRNGSGKTTLIKLISGLYSPSIGTITFNKISMDQINKELISRKLAVVLQDIQLFSGTIKDNILMGRKWIDEKSLESIIKSSGIEKMLATMPGGINATLSDRGQSLSTGQRQGIAIARALIAKPEILLLDESTSALDLNAEQDFVRKLKNQLFKTLIIVTHRLPILEVVDRIIVLAEGSIVIDGPKNEVIERLKLGKSRASE